MTRQVLDVGDRVKVIRHGLIELIDQEGVVVGCEGRYSVWLPEMTDPHLNLTHGWAAHHLERLGGDLQTGDFVQVQGVVTQMPGMTGETSVDWPVAVVTDLSRSLNEALIAPMHRTALFRCELSALTRIPRAEALA